MDHERGLNLQVTGSRKSLEIVNADRPAAAACLVHDGQASRAVLVKRPTRLVDRIIRGTASRRGAHDLVYANLGGAPVFSYYAVAHVALGDDANQFEVLGALDHGRTAAS